jgi:hypothetical protein
MYLIRRAIYQEDITILDIYVGAPDFIKLKTTE